MKGNFAAIVLIVIGAIALGVNLELFELDLVALLKKWWPLALIAIGMALFMTPEEPGKRS
jgi:ribose/xylose/arabinose/galactoside ABC-type transport system permease subunit